MASATRLLSITLEEAICNETDAPVCNFNAFNVFHDKNAFADHARLNLRDHHFALHMRSFAVEIGLTAPGVCSFMLKVQLLWEKANDHLRHSSWFEVQGLHWQEITGGFHFRS